MIFTSISFLLFFLAILLLYTITPSRFRWLLLLVSSYFFYACLKVPHLLIVLAAVSAGSYVFGLLIHKAEASVKKQIWLWIGISFNLSLLIWLKYIPFLAENLKLLLNLVSVDFRFGNVPQLVAIGASYFVFQGISYLIDIYLEILDPEKHAGLVALSLSFFPKLLQGPIERSGNFLSQLRNLSPCSCENLQAGANLFLWGMFKKVVIADRLATFVDPVYNNIHGYYGLSLIVATYLFAFQIYYDFSGYTDMALGVARCFNIRLTQNFNSPYLAESTPDFWRRWHISFSSWILDYIFKPLQFSFRDFSRWGSPLALMVTFIASGIWHGASWCFVAWGALHGIYLSSSVLFKKRKQKLVKSLRFEKSAILKVLQVFITFHLICFSWIFFRAGSTRNALYVAWNSIAGIPRSIILLSEERGAWAQHILLSKSPKEFLTVVLLIVLAGAIRAVDRRTAIGEAQAGELSVLARFPAWAKGGVYGVLLYMIAFTGADAQSFIYLQF